MVRHHQAVLLLLAIFVGVAGCQQLPPPPELTEDEVLSAPQYLMAPLDGVQLSVWRVPDLSVTVPVRPDGRIILPLVEDMQVAGKTPTTLGRDIEEAIRPYVQEPRQMIMAIGEVAQSVTVHYQTHMSVLAGMAQAQGLSEHADGNNAKLIRKSGGGEQTHRRRLKDLLTDGEMSTNGKVRPRDLFVIPKSLI